MYKSGKGFWDSTVVLSASACAYHDTTQITTPYDKNELDLTIFVSCYNEEHYIIDTLDTILKVMEQIKLTYEIIIIDDGSKDASITLVKDYIATHPHENIILRVNKFNKGLAQNFIDAAFIGRGKYYRLICGDNAEPIETIVKVFKMIGQADIIVPYYVSAEGKSLSRRIISKTYTHIINFVSGNRIAYYNGLQVHMRYNVMRWHPNTRGFGFQAALLCLLIHMGFTYQQVPCITIERRKDGGNALTWKNLRSVIHTIVSIFLRRLVFRRS